MKNNQSIFFPALIALTILGQACGDAKNEHAEVAQTPVMVQLANSSQATLNNNFEITGQIESANTSNIGTRVMGYITKVFVKAGDRVKAGQLLFTVNNADIVAKKIQVQAAIKQAEAALHVAQKDYDRYTSLYKQNSASAKELEQVTLQYQSAKANVESANGMLSEVSAQLAYTNVVAPFSGVITQKLVDEGSLANPGMPILSIEQVGTLQVSAMVPETKIALIQIGDMATMEVSAASKTFQGKVLQLNPSSQFSGGQFIVKLAIPASAKDKLLAGMYVKINIQPQLNKQQTKQKVDTLNGTTMLPVQSIVYRDQLTGIYTVSSQNTAMLRWLRLGKTIGNQVEVLSGLAKNESYIVSADGKLFNGASIKVK